MDNRKKATSAQKKRINSMLDSGLIGRSEAEEIIKQPRTGDADHDLHFCITVQIPFKEELELYEKFSKIWDECRRRTGQSPDFSLNRFVRTYRFPDGCPDPHTD